MAAITGFAQLEYSAAGHDFAAMVNKRRNHLFQIQRAWLAINQGHHVHAKGILELGVLKQVIEHNLWHFAATQLNHYSHTRLVRLISNIRDALDALFVHQFSNPFQQRSLVHLIRKFVNDDGLARALVDIFKVGLRPHDHSAATSPVALTHAGKTIDNSSSWEVWRRDQINQLINRCFRVLKHMQTASNDFCQVVWRNVGGHPHRDTRGSVDQEIWNAGGQD